MIIKVNKYIFLLILSVPIMAYMDYVYFPPHTLKHYLIVCSIEMLLFLGGVFVGYNYRIVDRYNGGLNE